MLDIMDKSGRIIRIRAEYFGGNLMASSHLSAEERVAELLKKLPAGELIRQPVVKSPAQEG